MNLHGLLLLHKESGPTSHDVVSQARALLNMKDIGHAGTLDPMASGLMVLLLGEGTKLSQYLLEKNKTYQAQVRLGRKTNTGDRTGEDLEPPRSQDEIAQLDPEKVKSAAQSLKGTFQWPVPLYSAKKVQGERLYDLARRGVQVEAPKKEMTFHGVDEVDVVLPLVTARVSCSKGSFLRTWAEQLGEVLGTVSCLETLQRLESEPFRLEQAVFLRDLHSLKTHSRFAGSLEFEKSPNSMGLQGSDQYWVKELMKTPSFIPLDQALPHLKSFYVDGVDEKMMTNGQISKTLKSLLISSLGQDWNQSQSLKILSKTSHQLLALVGFKSGEGFSVERVFRYGDSK